MIAINRQDVLAHQRLVAWPELHQAEQDLLLCLAMVAIFEDEFLQGQVAMRGGTVLHKVHLVPASRYSEDIDLVVIGKRPKEHIRAALKRVLRPVLGEHSTWLWDKVKLAIRNSVRASEILRVAYEVPAVSDPAKNLRVEVEANVTERKPFRPAVRLPFSVDFQGLTRGTTLVSFDVHEMLGTKLRALFQRKRGRDLFDLYRALERGAADPAQVIEAFGYYMAQEGTPIRRSAFLEALDERLADAGFCSDMASLLPAGVRYDPQEAGRLVRNELLDRLPP